MTFVPDSKRLHPIGAREIRLATGSVLFIYILTHLLNHAVGLFGLAAAETMLIAAKAVWHSLPGTVLLYGAAGGHVFLALRTVYLRQHWRLPLIEYVRLAAGFTLPLLLIGHVMTTRVALSLYGTDPKYASVVTSLIASGNEGWQLALLAPGWLHGCLGLWISLSRVRALRDLRWLFVALVVLIPCLAAAGFLAMRSEVAMQNLAPASRPGGAAETLTFWRQMALGFYLLSIAAVVAIGPVRRALLGRP